MAKILLVEDDRNLREIYGIRLAAEGYQISSAGDGEEALAMAMKERPDLILSDVMMPKISGFDMLDILRATPETQNIKVIMMTALSAEDQRARGEKLGADKFLVKSQVGIEDVVSAVKEVLTGQKNTEETMAPVETLAASATNAAQMNVQQGSLSVGMTTNMPQVQISEQNESQVNAQEAAQDTQHEVQTQQHASQETQTSQEIQPSTEVVQIGIIQTEPQTVLTAQITAQLPKTNVIGAKTGLIKAVEQLIKLEQAELKKRTEAVAELDKITTINTKTQTKPAIVSEVITKEEEKPANRMPQVVPGPEVVAETPNTTAEAPVLKNDFGGKLELPEDSGEELTGVFVEPEQKEETVSDAEKAIAGAKDSGNVNMDSTYDDTEMDDNGEENAEKKAVNVFAYNDEQEANVWVTKKKLGNTPEEEARLRAILDAALEELPDAKNEKKIIASSSEKTSQKSTEQPADTATNKIQEPETKVVTTQAAAESGAIATNQPTTEQPTDKQAESVPVATEKPAAMSITNTAAANTAKTPMTAKVIDVVKR